MTFTRRTLVIASGAATLAASVRMAHAQKAQFTFKYANNQPPQHPMNVRLKEATEAIAKESNGRMEIQVFPSNQLGSDTDTLSQLRSGGVEMFNLSGLILASPVPPAALNGLGFAFSNYDAVWKAMDGDVGAYIRGQIAKSNIHTLDRIWDNGFRQMTTSTKPINSAEDLRGFKIRVPVSPMWTSLFKAFDSAPTSINASEMYTALQTKVVDGQENPLAVISNFKLYEVQKYCSVTNHMWDGFWTLINRRAWDRLPPDLQQIVTKHINAAAMAERADLAAQNSQLRKDLEGHGMVFNTPRTDGFREKLRTAGFFKEWQGKFGDEAWSILERYTGKLG